MGDILYEFVDLDSDKAFQLFGKSFGGVSKNKSFCFDNTIAKGELIKSSPDPGLWIRKWKLTVFQKLTLRKMPPPQPTEKKFILIYFLDPAIFTVRNRKKHIGLNGPRNNMFLTSEVSMDFSVVPKQPFYVLDITFTYSWLTEQLGDADPSFFNGFNDYVNRNSSQILMEACSAEEYKLLNEVEVSMVADSENILFIRSRVYNLIISFFKKAVDSRHKKLIQTTLHYDQIVQAEKLLLENLKKPPKIEEIARKVNLSVSSLIRQFKLMYGKGVYEYYVQRKMELAKKMILENKVTVKEMAEMLGYKQSSPFIAAFAKQHGCNPGTLKLAGDQRIFY